MKTEGKKQKTEGNRQQALGSRQRAIQNPKSKIQNRAVAMGLFLVLTGIGCGYQFSGRGEGFPKDIRTVFVEPFVNRSRDIGIEWEITSALKSEFHRQGQLRVVDRLDQADAILSGVVRSFDSRVVAVNRNDEVLQFEMVLVVDMSLRRRSPDELLWRTQGTRLTELHSGSRGAVVTTSSDFKTGTLNQADVRQFTDIQLTETLSHKAKGQIVERFARELHQRLIEMF
ncbi:MAG: LPS assembly lipoprotein LptE [Candidatus Binatia bacterium]